MAPHAAGSRASFRVRLLPVAIFALVMMLGLKLGDLWTGFSGFVPVSFAQQASENSRPAVVQGVPPGGGQGAAAQRPVAEPDAAGIARGGVQAAARTEELPDDPALLSRAEIDLLQKLADRREQLDKWAQELDMREGLLKAAEQRIDRKVSELRTIQTKLQGMLRQYDKEQEDKLKSLVKIYETMKPKDAARIFMALDMNVLLDVIERMREAKASAIMADMDPQKAKDVTSELAARRKMGAEARREVPSSTGGEPPLPSSGPPPAVAAPGKG